MRRIACFMSVGLILMTALPVAAFAMPNEIPDPLPITFDMPNLPWVNSIAIAPDGTMYIGGNFTSINGVRRNHLAAISAKGEVLPWDPDPDDYVGVIKLHDSIIYVGGDF